MALRQRTATGLVIALISFSLLVPLLDGYLPKEESKTSSPRLAPISGPQKTIVILVRFSDKANSTSPSQVAATLNSVNNYYAENSYGQVSFQTDIAPSATASWYQMPSLMTSYGVDSSASDSQLIRDSLQAAYNAGVNIASYKYAIVVHSGNDEALTHTSNDIHSYTIPDFPFNPAPLVLVRISTAVVAETDPMGVAAHESGHLLGLPDLYDTTGQIDPTNNFVGYWELMALGEWNPNNGNPLISPGTYPSHMSIWSKIDLGFVPASRVATVQSGESANVTVENLEQSTTGFQAVKIPIAYNNDGSLSYYLVEMRAKQGTYDQHLPFPATYPGAGLLIYKVNESISSGSGSVRLIDAHPGGDLNDAPFGPCGGPCTSNNTFWDQTNYVKIIVTTTTPTDYTVSVDRTGSPPFLLQVNTPSPRVLVSIDGINMTSDASSEVRTTVRYGPHTIFVEARIPISLGSTTIQIGLTNAFAGWDDGGSGNPRGISVTRDMVLTALYRVTVEPSFTAAVVALVILAGVMLAATLYRRRTEPPKPTLSPPPSTQPRIERTSEASAAALLPGNDGLPGETVSNDEKADSSQPEAG